MLLGAVASINVDRWVAFLFLLEEAEGTEAEVEADDEDQLGPAKETSSLMVSLLRSNG